MGQGDQNVLEQCRSHDHYDRNTNIIVLFETGWPISIKLVLRIGYSSATNIVQMITLS